MAGKSSSGSGWGKSLARISMAAGGAGMLASWLFLASQSMENIVAGAAGFISGAVLIGAGLIAHALFTLADVWSARATEVYDDE